MRNATTIAGQTTIYLLSQSMCILGFDGRLWVEPPRGHKAGIRLHSPSGGGNRKCGSGAATGRRVRGSERDSQWSAFCKHGRTSQRPYQNIAKNRKPSLPKETKGVARDVHSAPSPTRPLHTLPSLFPVPAQCHSVFPAECRGMMNLHPNGEW